MKALEPSSFAANLLGPKTLILFFFKKSTMPLTKGSSGPTITMSILNFFTSCRIFLKSKILTSTLIAS